MGMPIPVTHNDIGVSTGDMYVVYNIILPKDINIEFENELLRIIY